MTQLNSGPTGQGTDTGQPPSPAPTATSDGSGSNAISQVEHQRLLEVERRRQSGQTRGYEQKIRELEQKMGELQARLESAPGTRPASSAAAHSAIDDLLARVNPEDPVVPALKYLHGAVNTITQATTRREQQEALDRDFTAALDDASRAGVPDNELDLSSPESVRGSTKEWLYQKRILDLEEKVTSLRDGTERAVTDARQQIGATAVSTHTGSAPVRYTVDSQITEVDGIIAEVKRRTGVSDAQRVAELHKANQAKQRLLAWKRDHPNGEPHPIRETAAR